MNDIWILRGIIAKYNLNNEEWQAIERAIERLKNWQNRFGDDGYTKEYINPVKIKINSGERNG